MTKDVLRLAGLLACVALATSRLGLIGHEVIAHGGVALAVGARVTEVELFTFAGGWIRYVLPGPSFASLVAIAVAGIALEIVVGLGLWLGVRGYALGRRLVRCAGAVLVVHACWYLAAGTFHGLGDGLVLYRSLAELRVPVAVAAGIATCIASYLGARAIVGPLVATLRGSPARRAAGFAIAALLAGGLHAALTIGELQMRRDPTYARVMQPERDRRIAIELADWQRIEAARGEAPTQQAVRARRASLEREHAAFPFVLVLGIATLASVAAGIVRSPRSIDRTIGRGLLVRAAALAAASIAAVIALQRVLPG